MILIWFSRLRFKSNGKDSRYFKSVVGSFANVFDDFMVQCVGCVFAEAQLPEGYKFEICVSTPSACFCYSISTWPWLLRRGLDWFSVVVMILCFPMPRKSSSSDTLSCASSCSVPYHEEELWLISPSHLEIPHFAYSILSFMNEIHVLMFWCFDAGHKLSMFCDPSVFDFLIV